MREEMAKMHFNLRNGCEGAQICLLSLRLVRIVRPCAHLGGEIMKSVHPISRQQVAYEVMDVEPLVGTALQARIVQVIPVYVDPSSH